MVVNKSEIIREWKKEVKKDGIKYFVLNTDDLFSSEIEDKQFVDFMVLLYHYVSNRVKKGKTTSKYWTVKRDKPYADEVKKIIEENEGVKL